MTCTCETQHGHPLPAYRRVRPAARNLILIVVSALVLAAGCSSTKSTEPVRAEKLTVLAAASLTEPFTEAQPALGRDPINVDARFSFGGSGTLVEQIMAGAPADVIATANTTTMQRLVDAGLVDEPKVFARNQLGILVAPGKPKKVSGLADLARSDLLVVLCGDDVPAGRYAAKALSSAGVSVKPRSYEPDVKAAVAKVTSGEADAAIVYVTDIAATGGKGELVPIAAGHNVVATYPIAVVKASANHAAAERFVTAIVSGPGQDSLRHHGFLPAESE